MSFFERLLRFNPTGRTGQTGSSDSSLIPKKDRKLLKHQDIPYR